MSHGDFWGLCGIKVLGSFELIMTEGASKRSLSFSILEAACTYFKEIETLSSWIVVQRDIRISA